MSLIFWMIYAIFRHAILSGIVWLARLNNIEAEAARWFSFFITGPCRTSGFPHLSLPETLIRWCSHTIVSSMVTSDGHMISLSLRKRCPKYHVLAITGQFQHTSCPIFESIDCFMLFEWSEIVLVRFAIPRGIWADHRLHDHHDIWWLKYPIRSER